MSNIRNKNIVDHASTELESKENQLKTKDKDIEEILGAILFELQNINLQLSFITDEKGEG